MRRTLLLMTIGLATLAACNSGNNTKTENAKVPAAPQPVRSNLNDTATGKLVDVLTHYYALKNALVATSSDKTTAAANDLSTSAKDLQGYLLTRYGMPGPLKPFLDTVIMQTRTIAESTDKTCEPQRLAFGTISSSVYGLITNAELHNMHIYHEFCPMAFNEKGAAWLSSESEIKNPYFGDKMLECGEVTDSIK
jgi:Protein of unknown function (DUF3347)